jgi:hypothetical protein
VEASPIITCGTLAGAIIPSCQGLHVTDVAHVQEVVVVARRAARRSTSLSARRRQFQRVLARLAIIALMAPRTTQLQGSAMCGTRCR